MKVSHLSGISTTYPNESIERVSFPKAKEVFNSEDCAGNGISPDATVIAIAFKDGSSATLEAQYWEITEL